MYMLRVEWNHPVAEKRVRSLLDQWKYFVNGQIKEMHTDIDGSNDSELVIKHTPLKADAKWRCRNSLQRTW